MKPVYKKALSVLTLALMGGTRITQAIPPCGECQPETTTRPQACVALANNCMNGVFGTGHSWTRVMQVTQQNCTGGISIISCYGPNNVPDQCCTSGGSDLTCPISTCS